MKTYTGLDKQILTVNVLTKSKLTLSNWFRDFHFRSRWVIVETHRPKYCECSYCAPTNFDLKKHLFPIGIKFPRIKAYNSWTYFYLKLGFVNLYLRWTGKINDKKK